MRQASVVLGMAATLLLVSGCATNSVSLNDAVLGEDSDWSLNQNATDATEELCTKDLPCTEAARSDQAVYTRFDSLKLAESYAKEIGADAYQSNFMVIDYSHSDIGNADRKEIEQWIDGIHAWS